MLCVLSRHHYFPKRVGYASFSHLPYTCVITTIASFSEFPSSVSKFLNICLRHFKKIETHKEFANTLTSKNKYRVSWESLLSNFKKLRYVVPCYDYFLCNIKAKNYTKIPVIGDMFLPHATKMKFMANYLQEVVEVCYAVLKL